MLTLGDQTRQILIVEDDADTAEMVSAVLESAGYSSVSVELGAQALNQIDAGQFDLVLLDINLPDMNGLEVLRKVRANSLLPMIVLSGFIGQRDKVIALESGADDYVGKPFSPEELLARVAALLRRVGWTAPTEVTMAIRHLEVDMTRRQAVLRGKKLHLTPIEYGILTTLMRAAGRVISHQELLRAVWGDDYRGDYSVLRVNVSRLRQKMEENPRQPTYIVTVPGQGYLMPMTRPTSQS
jgi:two-component system KDP operon response regulator KdpE